MSKSNDHEATFVVGLCKYLLNQGYQGEDITILTMYTGQVLILKKLMPNDIFQGVRLCSVDNYQGEENKIVILSLVRSNDENKIGFLKIENRVCVALSRAKVGFYAIGNMELLANNSTLWKRLSTRMEEKRTIGPFLELYCQNHPKDEHICAKVGDDFDKAPRGGCMKKCESRLDCGHACVEYCHIVECTTFKCNKQCIRTCPAGHQYCKRRCYDECEPCNVIVDKISPTCGHNQSVPCHEKTWECKTQIRCDTFLECKHTPDKLIYCYEKDQYNCMEQCKTICQNNHPCPKPCYEMCGNCTEPITKVIPKCKHSQLVPCHLDPDRYSCIEICHMELDCGHQADVPCNEKGSYICREIVEHIMPGCGHSNQVDCYSLKRLYPVIKCKSPCEKTLKCGHGCKKLCYEECERGGLRSLFLSQYSFDRLRKTRGTALCQERCLKNCSNGHRCKRKCYEKCGKCFEKVAITLNCGHTKDLPCHVKTAVSSSEENELEKDLVKCLKTCERKCENGHACKRKCFEECQPCNVYIVKEIPKCGHNQKIECRLDPSGVLCTTQCKTQLICGHEATIPCHQLTNRAKIMCAKSCTSKLPCGHMCGGTCASCHQGNVHTPCKAKCSRLLPCGHKCTKPCDCTDCGPCREKCRQRCEHKVCHRNCSDPCEPCFSRCGVSCKHGSCRNTCSLKCDKPRCTEYCSIKFTCGKCRKKKPCLGMCGEKCPRRCKVCDFQEITSALLGKKLTNGTRFILLEDCNHIIEMSYLDNYMLADDKGNTIVKVKLCPKCKAPIIRSRRYKHTLADIVRSTKLVQEKKILLTNEEFIRVEENMTKAMQQLATVDQEKHSMLESVLETSKNRNELDIDQLRAILIQATVVTSLVDLRGQMNLKNTDDEETDYPNKKRLKECIDTYTNEILSPRRLMSSFELMQFKDEYRKLSILIKDNPEDILNSQLGNTVPEMMSLVEKFRKKQPEGSPMAVFDSLIINSHERQPDDEWMFCFKGHVWKVSDGANDCPTCKAEGTTFVKKMHTANNNKPSRDKMNDVDKYCKPTEKKKNLERPPSAVTAPGEMVGIGARAKTHSAVGQGYPQQSRQGGNQQFQSAGGKYPKQAWSKRNKSSAADPDHKAVADKSIPQNTKEKTEKADKQRQQTVRDGDKPKESTGQAKRKRQRRKKK